MQPMHAVFKVMTTWTGCLQWQEQQLTGQARSEGQSLTGQRKASSSCVPEVPAHTRQSLGSPVSCDIC